MPITKASGNSVTAAAKGDLVVGNATNDSGVLSVGANNTVLTADSSTATGLKWGTPPAAVDNFGSLVNTSFSSVTSINITGITNINTLLMFIYYTDGSGNSPTLRINGDSGSNYRGWMNGWQTNGSSDNGSGYLTTITSAVLPRKWTTGGMHVIEIKGSASSGRKAITSWYSSGSGSALSANSYASSSTVSSIEINWGTNTTGNYILLGA